MIYRISSSKSHFLNEPISARQLIAVVLTLSLLSAVVCPPVQATASTTVANSGVNDGHLILETKYVGLTVRINGKAVGRTPLEPYPLAPGLHKISVSHPEPANWFDQDWSANVKISPGDTLRVPVIFKKSYSINSNPFGATVLLGQDPIGETPIFFKLFEHDLKRVTLSKAGFSDTTFALGATAKRFFDIRLRPRTAALQVAPGAISSDFGRNPRSKVYLYSAAGLTLVSGALAIYFRNRGNEKFELYKSTGNPDLTDKLFSDTKKFDRLSAVSFGVFQISFAATFYLFLKETNR